MKRTPIERIAGSAALPDRLRGGVVAIGNFDGVHRGHQAVLKTAGDIARSEGLPLVCLTFEPHPRTVFSPDRPVSRLTPAPMKARLLDLLGFDAVVEQRFDRVFAGRSPEEFVDRILCGDIDARKVVAGFDFHYGAKRAGTPQRLKDAGRAKGFDVTLVPALRDGAGDTVSSSRIRDYLSAGRIDDANALLSYRWTVRGEVVHGKKLGRTLGYPTANLVLAQDDILAHGIYAVRLRRADGTLYDGVASFGRRPTFDDGAALFETYLFDMEAEFYGETVDVSLFAFQRHEEKFETVESLVEQMHRDAAEARSFLADVSPLSELDRQVAFAAR